MKICSLCATRIGDYEHIARVDNMVFHHHCGLKYQQAKTEAHTLIHGATKRNRRKNYLPRRYG